MTDFSQLIRWNAGLVRGLAQSVLARAKVIRSSLTPKPEVEVKARKPSLKRQSSPKKVRAGAKARTANSRRTKRDNA